MAHALAGRPKTPEHRQHLRDAHRAYTRRVKRALLALSVLERKGVVVLSDLPREASCEK